MLYSIHGDDRIKVKKKQQEVLSQLRSKRPNAHVVILDSENFSEAKLDELIQGGGLFDEKHVVSINNLFSDKKYGKAIAERVKGMALSPSAFVCVDETIEDKILKSIEKSAYKTASFEKSGTKGDDGAIFALADAVGGRASAPAWVLYQKFLRRGLVPEEIHGAIFWQVKNMAIAHAADRATKSGLSPFVYQKSSRFAKNFSQSELCDLLHLLVSMYHDSRSEDGEPLGTGLERFLLLLKRP